MSVTPQSTLLQISRSAKAFRTWKALCAVFVHADAADSTVNALCMHTLKVATPATDSDIISFANLRAHFCGYLLLVG